MVHISCITCPRDLPDMYTHTLGPNGPQAWVYISGKSLRYMIQLLHIALTQNVNEIYALPPVRISC